MITKPSTHEDRLSLVPRPEPRVWERD